MHWHTDVSINTVSGVIVFVIVLFVSLFFPLLRPTWNRFVYQSNADYIEISAFMQTSYRIAKRGKLGLFDKKQNKVILRSLYDNITKFDVDHILIEKNGKKGLYSLKNTKLIVPIQYERIDPFKNSVVKCYHESKEDHYDVNGNFMR